MFLFSNKPFVYSLQIHFFIKKLLFLKIIPIIWRSFFTSLYIRTSVQRIYCIKSIFIFDSVFYLLYFIDKCPSRLVDPGMAILPPLTDVLLIFINLILILGLLRSPFGNLVGKHSYTFLNCRISNSFLFLKYFIVFPTKRHPNVSGEVITVIERR